MQYLNVSSFLSNYNEVCKESIIPLIYASPDKSLHREIAAIPAIVNFSIRLENLATNYFENANNVFNLTEKYIKLLAISESIPAQKDSDGNIIFDIRGNYPGNA